MAARPTPLDAALMSTVSPGLMLPYSTIRPYAVVYAINVAAPDTASTPAGRCTSACAGRTTDSAYVPYSVMRNVGTALTASPTEKPSTSSPTASITRQPRNRGAIPEGSPGTHRCPTGR